MTDTTDMGTSIPPVPDPTLWRTQAVSLRNGLVAVTTVLAVAVILTSDLIFSGWSPWLDWIVAPLLALAFGLLAAAVIRSFRLSGSQTPTPLTSTVTLALSGVALLGIALIVAWIGPRSTTMGQTAVVRWGSNGSACGTVEGIGEGFVRVTIRERAQVNDEGKWQDGTETTALIRADAITTIVEVDECPGGTV